MRTILVGDVHGCLDELEALLSLCAVAPGDEVILVGDLTVKGPDSQGVVQLCRERGLRAVLGNHDEAVLRKRHEPVKNGRPSRHQEVAAALRAEDLAYLEALPLYLPLDEHGVLVVHGGLVPGVPLAAQTRAHLLNLRSLLPDGRPSTKALEGVPWASRWPGPAHVVFGHDALRGLQRHEHATGIDTGCVYGKALTALLLPERRLVSVPARRAYAPID